MVSGVTGQYTIWHWMCVCACAGMCKRSVLFLTHIHTHSHKHISCSSKLYRALIIFLHDSNKYEFRCCYIDCIHADAVCNAYILCRHISSNLLIMKSIQYRLCDETTKTLTPTLFISGRLNISVLRTSRKIILLLSTNSRIDFLGRNTLIRGFSEATATSARSQLQIHYRNEQ